MAAKYSSSSETTNYARLSRLVVDVCCDLLRAVLQSKLPPPGLTAILLSQQVQLCKQLEQRQRHILYPSGGVLLGTLQDLDFTLLYKLVRNLLGINIPPHQNGWGKKPDDADRSLSANIDRLRVQRNEAYGHLPTASLSDVDFNDRWGIIRQSIFEIEKGTLTGDTYVTSVDALLTMSMDPDTEKYYIEELEKHYMAELEIKVIALEVKGAVADVTTKQKAMALDIGVIKEDVLAVKYTLSATAANTRHTKEIHPDLLPMIETTKAMITEELKKGFIDTKGFRDAKEKLQKNRLVVIKGNTGDGKTSTAIQLLHWLSEEQHDRKPVQLHNIQDLDFLAPTSKVVTFVDDIFGEKDLREKDVQEWNKRITSVIPRLSGNEPAQANFLLITIRNEVYNSLKKRSLETVFTDLNIIDLSSDTYKVAEEKKSLLELYEPKNCQFSWKKKEKEEIVDCAPNVGFPQCCRLFRDFPELQKKRVQFFQKPLYFLNEALSKLGECHALLFLFLNNGMIRIKDLDPNIKNTNKTLIEEAFEIDLSDGDDDRTTLTYKKKVEFVKKSLDTLSGFLVVKDKHWSGDDVYRFYHDSIYVAVALLYGKITPIGYIENCPCKSLSYLTTAKTSLDMIVISSDHYADMCERLLREFECKRNDYGTSIGSLVVWNDRVFVERFVRLLNDRKVDKRDVLNKTCVYGAEECALYLLCGVSNLMKTHRFAW